MSKHKLSKDDQQRIAHYITQRYLNGTNGISAGEYLKATQEYLDTYNCVMDKLLEYNTSIIE